MITLKDVDDLIDLTLEDCPDERLKIYMRRLMARRRTRPEKYADYFQAYKKVQADEPVKRDGAKDGSIPTHPFGDTPDLPESDVLKGCLTWLRAHHILCDRNNVGAGQMGSSGYHSYGIKDAGDIIGLLPNGTHFEIECKRGSGGKLSKGQQERWRNVVANNGLYFVIHGIGELEYYFEDLI